MALHALLGPSSSKRWMTCPPSARLGELYEDVESEYAIEGTEAHTLSELQLLIELSGNDGAAIAEYQDFMASSPYYNMEMGYNVDIFVNEVLRRFEEAKARSSDAILMPEQYLRYDEWVPDGFGTGDVTIISDHVLEIIDLKYGKGVPVFAENNPQAMMYGLGAYSMYHMLYDIRVIRCTIIQPRLDSITSMDITIEDLLAWAENEVRPAALKAWNCEGEIKAGKHCQFCKVKPDCEAYKALPPGAMRPGFRGNTLEDAMKDFL